MPCICSIGRVVSLAFFFFVFFAVFSEGMDWFCMGGWRALFGDGFSLLLYTMLRFCAFEGLSDMK